RTCFSRYPDAPATIAERTASSSGYDVNMTTRVFGNSARISRQASIPEPSGRRTSMTMMSGSKRRAASIDSATVPASATTWNPGRRSRRATRPWRTTSWSSTTSSRSWRGGAVPSGPVTRFPSSSRRVFRLAPHRHRDDDSRPPPGASKLEATAERSRTIAHVGNPVVTSRDGRRRIEADTVVSDLQTHAAVHLSEADVCGRRVRVPCDVRQRFPDDLQQLSSDMGGDIEPLIRKVELELDDVVLADLVGERHEETREIRPVDLFGAQADHELSEIGDRGVQCVDGSIDGRGRFGRVLHHQIRHVLQGQGDGVQRLDDPVVEVLPDPLALVDDSKMLDGFVQ